VASFALSAALVWSIPLAREYTASGTPLAVDWPAAKAIEARVQRCADSYRQCRGSGVCRKGYGESARTQSEAALDQSLPQFVPRRGQSAFHRADRPAEPLGGLVLRQSLKAAQDQRRAEFLRQRPQLTVEDLLQLAPRRLDIGKTGTRSPGFLLMPPPPLL